MYFLFILNSMALLFCSIILFTVIYASNLSKGVYFHILLITYFVSLVPHNVNVTDVCSVIHICGSISLSVLFVSLITCLWVQTLFIFAVLYISFQFLEYITLVPCYMTFVGIQRKNSSITDALKNKDDKLQVNILYSSSKC